MKIIIAPAKKMRIDTDSFNCNAMPIFLKEAKTLLELMKEKSYEELKRIWKCSDRIAKPCFENLHEMKLTKNLTPAVMSYDGIAFRYMAPDLFSYDELDYIESRLTILSGFYGILRPFDAVAPYRLEMRAKLKNDKGDNLYDFWGDKIAKRLFCEDSTIVNLASEEYSRCISRYLNKDIRFITCVFGKISDGRVKESGTQCKMARGEMVRYMAEKKIEKIEDIKLFDRLGYSFNEYLSDGCNYVFVKNIQK